MNTDYQARFSGIGRLYGADAQETLASSHVAVVGIGGVGSWTVEALARSGVGQITLVDMDEICITNVNRQLHARDGKIGQLKIDAMAERARGINPSIQLNLISGFFNEKSADAFFKHNYDGIVDAIDSGMQKALLIAKCRDQGIPVITCGAAGGKTDPTQITTGDLARTRGDALLLQLRKTLRNRFRFPKHPDGQKKIRKFHVTAVYSEEIPMFPQCDGTVGPEKSDGQHGGRLNCADGFGSSAPMTGTFGLVAAAEVIKLITQKSETPSSSS